MSLTSDNIVTRLLIAVLLYFLLNAVIDTVVTDPQANKIFKIVLLVICLAIVFVGGLFLHF